jgi:ABC-2 type transport system permease protein
METATPSAKKIFFSLFKADVMVQWRNRRASLMSILVPILVLISWKGIIATMGAAFAIASCITIGLVATGLMGYANTTARDREKGIFQRLRVTPASTTDIMLSRIAVQLLQMAVMTVLVFIAAHILDGITLSAGGYVLGLLAATLCGGVFLALGLTLVGLISNAETVNSVSRLLYIALILVGAIGELGVLGTAVKNIVVWSPYGSVKVLILAALAPATWGSTALIALIATIVYVTLFTWMGIRWFKWSSN